MKKIVLLALLVPFFSHAQFSKLFKKKTSTTTEKNTTEKNTTVKGILESVTNVGTTTDKTSKKGNSSTSKSILENLTSTGTSSTDIAAGLREALNKGVTEQVTKLTGTDGFYKNEMVKILLPEELQKVDRTLRSLGMGSLADEGIKVLNRAAEEAVKEATPIFVDAVKNITFTDAKDILLGEENAATTYLQKATTSQLYTKFNPVIQSSLSKVGADSVWSTIISKYNTLPLVTKVNPDLNDYVTNKTMDGVFKMISVEEKDIRTNVGARSTGLLQKVFALQDKK